MVKGKAKKSSKKTKKCDCKSCYICSPKVLFPIIAGVIAVVLILIFTLMSTSASAGDKVMVNYVGSFEDGSVFDTSIESVGLENGLERQSYEPFTFTLGAGEVVPGFDAAVDGMSVGDSKTVTLTPDEAYGAPSEELIFELPLLQSMKRYDTLLLTDFEGVFDELMVGEVTQLEGLSWKIEVVELNETHIKVENLLAVEDLVQLPYVSWFGEVVEVTEDSLIVLQMPKLGELFMLPMGGAVRQGVITEVGEENFKVDLNSKMAGKSLTFEIELLEIL